jgi:hypothetical protein
MLKFLLNKMNFFNNNNLMKFSTLILTNLILSYLCRNIVLIEIFGGTPKQNIEICKTYTDSDSIPTIDIKRKYIICPGELKSNLLRQYPIAPCLICFYDNNYLIILKRTSDILPAYPGINFLLEDDLMCSRFFYKRCQSLEQSFVHDYEFNYFHLALDINREIKVRNYSEARTQTYSLLKLYLGELDKEIESLDKNYFFNKEALSKLESEKGDFKSRYRETLNYLYEILFFIYLQQDATKKYLTDYNEMYYLTRDYVDYNNSFLDSFRNNFFKNYFFGYYYKFQLRNDELANEYFNKAAEFNEGDPTFKLLQNGIVDKKAAIDYLKKAKIARYDKNIEIKLWELATQDSKLKKNKLFK